MPRQYSYPGAWIARTNNVYQWIQVRERDSWLIAVNRKPKSSNHDTNGVQSGSNFLKLSFLVTAASVVSPALLFTPNSHDFLP